jgi:hypothetical protein
MARFTSPLDNIKIASPCSANWEGMYGTDRKRLCGECNMNVYNLSAMTRSEAENLIMNAEGRLCARFYRRPDGTIVTRDCPVGLKAARQRVVKMWGAVASLVLAFLAGLGITSLFGTEEEPVIMGEMKIEQPITEVPVMGAVPVQEYEVQGDVAYSDVMGKIKVEDKQDR